MGLHKTTQPWQWAELGLKPRLLLIKTLCLFYYTSKWAAAAVSKVIILCFFLFFLSFGPACRILVSQPGIKSVLPAVEVRSLNPWTAKEVRKGYSALNPFSLSPSPFHSHLSCSGFWNSLRKILPPDLWDLLWIPVSPSPWWSELDNLGAAFPSNLSRSLSAHCPFSSPGAAPLALQRRDGSEPRNPQEGPEVPSCLSPTHLTDQGKFSSVKTFHPSPRPSAPHGPERRACQAAAGAEDGKGRCLPLSPRQTRSPSSLSQLLSWFYCQQRRLLVSTTPVILCSSLRILSHVLSWSCWFLGLLPFEEEVMCGREVTGKAYTVPPSAFTPSQWDITGKQTSHFPNDSFADKKRSSRNLQLALKTVPWPHNNR